jgi:hypothetical protein
MLIIVALIFYVVLHFSRTLRRGKKLFTARLQTYEFTVISYFLESDPLPAICFPCFEVRKWT